MLRTGRMAKRSTLQPPGEARRRGRRGWGRRTSLGSADWRALAVDPNESPAQGRGFSRDEEKSSIGGTDGRSFNPVLQLRQAAVDAGFRGIDSLLQPLKAAAEPDGDIAAARVDDALD